MLLWSSQATLNERYLCMFPKERESPGQTPIAYGCVGVNLSKESEFTSEKCYQRDTTGSIRDENQDRPMGMKKCLFEYEEDMLICNPRIHKDQSVGFSCLEADQKLSSDGTISENQ